MLFVYSGVCVTRYLVLCVCFVDVVCVYSGVVVTRYLVLCVCFVDVVCV